MSKRVVYTAIGMLLVVWVSTAGAAGQPLRVLIKDLLTQEGQAYLDARAALLAGDYDLGEFAQRIREEGGYGAQAGATAKWLLLAFTDALALHKTHPQEASRLLNLQGLDPEVYERRRKPVPSALRELRQLRPVAPLLMEFYLKGMDWYAWSSNAAAETERQTLQAELLTVIGESAHEARVPFLTNVVQQGDSLSDAVLRTAVRALGRTGSPDALPVLLTVLEDARSTEDIALYAATVRALGGIRDVQTWPHLKAELSHTDPQVQAAAIGGARAYASRWHWDHDPAQGDTVRWEVGVVLVDILAETDELHIIRAVLASVGSLATPDLQALLQTKVAAAALDAEADDAEERLEQALALVTRRLARR